MQGAVLPPLAASGINLNLPCQVAELSVDSSIHTQLCPLPLHAHQGCKQTASSLLCAATALPLRVRWMLTLLNVNPFRMTGARL
jgi:hypothetical protein